MEGGGSDGRRCIVGFKGGRGFELRRAGVFESWLRGGDGFFVGGFRRF